MGVPEQVHRDAVQTRGEWRGQIAFTHAATMQLFSIVNADNIQYILPLTIIYSVFSLLYETLQYS